MKSICAGEATLGHVMMWVLIIALIGVVSRATWEKTKHAALFHKRTAAPNCTPGTCEFHYTYAIQLDMGTCNWCKGR
jgi:hypothetical protein